VALSNLKVYILKMLINTAQNKNSGRGGSSGSLEHLPLSTKNSKQAERKEGGA
jgi:hypothetical protein